MPQTGHRERDEQRAAEILAEARKIYDSAEERAAGATTRATTLQGAVAIAGSLLLAGAGLILDGTKVHGTGWRVAFAAALLAAIVALVMSGVRALSATSTIHRWHRPTATDIVRRSQLSLTQARVQLAAETLVDYGFNSKIAAWKVAYLGAAAWWFRIALAVLLALATIVCAYAIVGPIRSSGAPDTLPALDPIPPTTTTPHVEDTLTTATVWLAVGDLCIGVLYGRPCRGHKDGDVRRARGRKGADHGHG